ncbi:MAG: Nif3-like dinuclear metal center hexameric protein [Promethearchaeota archaeon]
MKVFELLNHFKEIGTWVNWNNTVDKVLFGDPQTEIEAMAVAWMPSFLNLKKAKSMGCNLFITHEPLYAGFPNEFGVYLANNVLLDEDDIWVEKGKWLEENKMVVLRCHDTWDDFPEIGIHGSWAKWLGFNAPPIKQVKFYEVHQFKPMKLSVLARSIQMRLSKLGQDVVMYIGDPDQEVSSIVLGTGAITNYRYMSHLGGDVLLLTDDGTTLWQSAQWAEDSGKPIIIVNHATAEEPGIRSLGRYLSEKFPTIKVHTIERGCLYRAVYEQLNARSG